MLDACFEKNSIILLVVWLLDTLGMSNFTFCKCVALLDFSAVRSGKCLFTLNCSSNYLVLGEGDLLQGLPRTVRLFILFRS